MSSLSYSINDDHPDWRLLSDIDESEDYSVDIAEIWLAPNGKFMLVTASGCSCWSGEYEFEPFETLEDLERSILMEDRYYPPTLVGGKYLVTQARQALAAC